jgi:hypothetical protein
MLAFFKSVKVMVVVIRPPKADTVAEPGWCLSNHVEAGLRVWSWFRPGCAVYNPQLATISLLIFDVRCAIYEF